MSTDVPEWHGHVTDVDGDVFAAVLSREGAPDVLADFGMTDLSGVVPGDLIVVTPDSVRRLELPPWTQKQLDEIRARARKRAARFAGYAERGARPVES